MTTAIIDTDIFDKVKTVVMDVLNVPEEKVTMEADFREDLEAESLDLISVISELEEVFDQDITDDDAMTLKSVGDAVRFIETGLAKKA